jgi:hypothetical protein
MNTRQIYYNLVGTPLQDFKIEDTTLGDAVWEVLLKGYTIQ